MDALIMRPREEETFKIVDKEMDRLIKDRFRTCLGSHGQGLQEAPHLDSQASSRHVFQDCGGKEI